MSNVETVQQLSTLAGAIARQGMELYRDLASRMEDLGTPRAREAFEHIRAIVRDAAEAELGDTPRVLHDEELGATQLARPYAAYSLAVRNQERAFAFWTYISANASQPAVRSEAEHLARAELDRVKSLRSARRAAFHASRPPALAAETLRTASREELRRQAGATEAALAELHARIAAALPEDDPRASALSELAVEERQSARELGAPPQTDRAEALPQDPSGLLALATERLEAAVELYLAAAEASRREEVVSVAQDLADRGIRRLSRLR